MGLSLALGNYLGATYGGQGGEVLVPPPPFSRDSLWNTAIPNDPVLHANSANIVSTWAGWGGPQALQIGDGGTADSYHVPAYVSSPDDPLHTISIANLDAQSLPIQGKQIRIPAGAKPAGGSDGHIVVIVGKDVYEFAVATVGAGTISASYGGRTRLYGDGFGNARAYAAKTAALAGRITSEEMVAAMRGEIDHFDHAIAVMVKNSNGTAWPASGLGMNTGGANAPFIGAHRQSTYTLEEIDALGLLPLQRVIQRTRIIMGEIAIDTTGDHGSSVPRSCSNDDADIALGKTPRVLAEVLKQGEAGGWYGDGLYYFDYGAGIDETRSRILDPTYMKAQFDARVAYKRLIPKDPVTSTGSITLVPIAGSGGSILGNLLDAAYAPFVPNADPRIGINAAGEMVEFRLEPAGGPFVLPEGRTLMGLNTETYANTAANVPALHALKAGETVKDSDVQPAGQTYSWRILAIDDIAGVDLGDIRERWENQTVTGATATINNYGSGGSVEVL